MKLRHPFQWLTASSWKWAFVILLVLMILVMVGLQVLGAPLKTAVAPTGIVSFELAKELSAAQSIVTSWGDTGRVYAGLNLGLDYLFLVAYAGAIGLGCVLIAHALRARGRFLPAVGIVLAWGVYGAALLDAVENYALIRLLLGAQAEVWPVLAYWCAVPKFLLVGAGLLYIVAGGIVAAVVSRRRGAPVNGSPR